MKHLWKMTMTQRFLIALLLNMLLSATGCAQLTGAPWAEVNGRRFSIEIADNDETRTRGLMFVHELASDAGMLFIHDREEVVAYWMKNTYIALDILYFDEQLKLVSAQLNVQPCGDQPRCPIYLSYEPAKYVLEVNAGIAEQIKLKKGDQLKLSEAVMSK